MHTNVNKDANRVSSRTTQTRAHNKAAKGWKVSLRLIPLPRSDGIITDCYTLAEAASAPKSQGTTPKLQSSHVAPDMPLSTRRTLNSLVRSVTSTLTDAAPAARGSAAGMPTHACEKSRRVPPHVRVQNNKTCSCAPDRPSNDKSQVTRALPIRALRKLQPVTP